MVVVVRDSLLSGYISIYFRLRGAFSKLNQNLQSLTKKMLNKDKNKEKIR